HQLPGAGMANADAHARVVVADMSRDGAQAVVTGVAAADFHLQLAGREVQLVMEDIDVGFRDLEIALRLADGPATVVHVGLRLQQRHAMAADQPVAGQSLEALLPRRQPVPLGDALERHEADVVAMARVLAARIAEADEKLHAPSSPLPDTPARARFPCLIPPLLLALVGAGPGGRGGLGIGRRRFAGCSSLAFRRYGTFGRGRGGAGHHLLLDLVAGDRTDGE